MTDDMIECGKNGRVIAYGLIGGGVSVYLNDVFEASEIKPQLEAIMLGLEARILSLAPAFAIPPSDKGE